MKFKKILVIDISENSLKKDTWDKIDMLTEERVMIKKDSSDLRKELETTECILASLLIDINKEIIDSAPKLKYIGVLSTGYGKVDHEYAAQKGIAVCNIPGYSTEGVAEFCFGIILEHIRELSRGKQQAGNLNFSESSFFNVSEIKNKKFGIIGLGNIGSRIAEIALGFDADVRYWSRRRKEGYESKGVEYQDIDELINECDFISLNLALNKDTQGFVSKKRIQMMKPGSVLINLSPNELLDFDALLERLDKGDITYIFDHTDELTEEQAKLIAGYKNCVMYPPIAYTTQEATEAKLGIFIENVENFLKGELTNKVN